MINTEIPSNHQTISQAENKTISTSKNLTVPNQDPQPSKRTKEIKENQKAIEDYKKICAKTYASPSTQIISQLRSDTLNLFLENFELKGINAIVKILINILIFYILN